MNLKLLAIAITAGLVTCYAWGLFQHHEGYSEGQADLLAQQEEQERVKLAKQTTRQQADDAKAAAADDAGAAKTVTITQEVIRYVKTPGRDVCRFDADRVRIKSDAVKNAAAIPGYDDVSMQTNGTER